MSLFSITWDAEVKKLAEDCVKEPDYLRILVRDNDNLTDKEKEYVEEVNKKYKDPYGMYAISHMIWSVEHALADGREELASMAIVRVYNVLTEDSYFENVFDKDETSEEWKSRVALANGLAKLISLM